VPAGLSDPGISKPTPTLTPTPLPPPALLISSPGYYTLDHDLASDWAGVVIASSDVVLDGMGHLVEGPGDAPVYVYGSGAGVAARGDWQVRLSNVTVRNITVRNWWRGIDIEHVDGATVENVLAEGSHAGFYFALGDAGVLRDSTFRKNIGGEISGVGLYLDFMGDIAVERCSVTGNGIGIVGTVPGTPDAPLLIADSEISGNEYTGITLYDGGWLSGIRNCTVAENGGDGIRFEQNHDPEESYPGGGAIAGNRIERNVGIGLNVVDWPGLVVSGNRIAGNAVGVGGGSTAAPEVWNNLLNNTVNADFPVDGAPPLLNATRSAGPNIVGGSFVGGNYWAAPDGSGFSEAHADADGDGFCDDAYTALPGVVDYLPLALPAAPSVATVPGGAAVPTDHDGDGLYDDVNGNGRADFADVVLYFNTMSWIAANEPLAAFDCNGNARIDFADVVWLFNHL